MMLDLDLGTGTKFSPHICKVKSLRFPHVLLYLILSENYFELL